MDILEPYLDTGVNLTTFRFRYEGSVARDLMSTAADDDKRLDDNNITTIHDALLTLYHGVRLSSRAGDGCQWAKNNLLPTLAKVSISL